MCSSDLDTAERPGFAGAAAALQKPLSDKDAKMAPPPISALKPKLGMGKPRGTHQDIRVIQATERTQIARRQDTPARDAVRGASPSEHDEGGFVAKVLQPDGSLIEEYFSAKAPR